jgi:hypothetical protein
MSDVRITNLQAAGAAELDRQEDEIDALGPGANEGLKMMMKFQAQENMDKILVEAEASTNKSLHDELMVAANNCKA